MSRKKGKIKGTLMQPVAYTGRNGLCNRTILLVEWAINVHH